MKILTVLMYFVLSSIKTHIRINPYNWSLICRSGRPVAPVIIAHEVREKAKIAVTRPYRSLSSTTTSAVFYRSLNRFTMSMTQTTINPCIVPVVGPAHTPAVVRRLSNSSIRTLSDIPRISSAASFTSSAGSIPFEDGDVDVVTEDGLRHANMNLEARCVFSSQWLLLTRKTLSSFISTPLDDHRPS